MKPRFKMTATVEWNKDLVPGFNYEIEDFQRLFKMFVETTLMNYEPKVTIENNSMSIDGESMRMHVAEEFIDGEPPIGQEA